MTERYRPSRNLVRRPGDGKLVNVARFRGNLFYCKDACCCGREDLGNAPVPANLYHDEWMRRRLRNYVHLTEAGCLGPCALANVALLLFDGQALWLHSLDNEASVLALFDYIEELLVSDGFVPPRGALAEHAFTASTWQPRPDGMPVDDVRAWRGPASRPDTTPACELPGDAFLPASYEFSQPAASGPAVDRAVAAMDGAAALPRKNGELVFAEPWEGRAFGMAVSLNEAGAFTWDQFRDRLIARIAEAEATSAPLDYYRCWLAALEDALAQSGLIDPEQARERTFEFEFGERQDIY